MALTIFLLLLSAAIGNAVADHDNNNNHVRTFDWEVAAARIAPDGYPRSAALVNGRYPGPPLLLNKGDSVTVNLKNKLDDPSMRRSTSIHWHGIFQHRNAQNDGPSFVTQCPISPGHSYKYDIALGNQAGTFWYHSHLSTQYADGIRGVMVIYDPNDPFRHMYDVDDENTIITLSDWYHFPALGATDAWFAGGIEPVPDSGLINGVGRYTAGYKIPWARVNVTQGQRYRFRIVGMSVEGDFEFAIANHSMTIIEADGITHEPYTVNALPVLPAQRYSVIVNANQPIGNYWIRATQTVRNSTNSTDNPNFNGNNVYAVLHYQGAPDRDPVARKPRRLAAKDVAFKEYKLKPHADPGPPGGRNPPNLHFFNMTFNISSPNADAWTINGIQYKSATVPTLLNILAKGYTHSSQFAKHENVFILPRDAVVEVAIVGPPGHAFHLHGHAFYIVQSASGGPPNYIDPPRRDVAASGGTPTRPLRIRFPTNNPGPWMLHCHIDWHLEAGLAVVFAEDPSGIRNGTRSVRPDPEWKKLCDVYKSLDPALQ